MGSKMKTANAGSSRAFWTWCADLATVVLTAVYCGVAFHDIHHGKAVLTSPRWYDRGFCVWEGGGWNSHRLCCAGDLAVGGLILGLFASRYQRETRPNAKEALQLVMATAGFTIMHGLGHLFIGDLLGDDFMQSVRPDRLSFPLLCIYYLLLCGFLALGPYLGVRNTLLGETGPLPERLPGTESSGHSMVHMAPHRTPEYGQQSMDRQSYGHPGDSPMGYNGGQTGLRSTWGH